MVRAITAEVGVGELFTGKVTRLMGMGAFVEFLPGKEGLVHTQYLSEEPVRRPDDVVKVGDEIKVRVIEVDPQGRVNLSAIHVEGEFDPSTVKPREERGGPRGGGRFGDRGGRDRDRGPRERGFDRGDRGGGDPDRGFRGRPDPMATSTASDETPKARFRPRR
jgi:polyribonucleotide nucleotidyltransferase